MKKVNQNVVFGTIFLIIIYVTAVISNYRIINYYMQDVVINEDINSSDHPFEAAYTANLFGKAEYIDFNGALRTVLGQREMNGVLKLNNGYLVQTIKLENQEQLAGRAQKTAELDKYLEKRGIDFLYVSTPYTVSKYDSQLPAGEEDYGNENIDIFLNELTKRNVECFDLRESMKEERKDQYDYFFKTDHHWTPEGGFLAYKMICEYMQENLEYKIPKKVMQLESYNIVPYRNLYLGSNGQRTGSLFNGNDNFDLIEPKFETNLIRESDKKEGSFQEVLINHNPLSSKKLNSKYVYDEVYKNALEDWENKNSLCDKKILMICDSMGEAVNPYFIITFSEVKTASAYAPSQKLSLQFIEEYQPDLVILMQYPLLLGYDDSYDFGINN
ncbi:MAG: DHHW family protein [Lachnospiraceae bacterium]